jgi:hypothetical protein
MESATWALWEGIPEMSFQDRASISSLGAERQMSERQRDGGRDLAVEA